MKSKYINFSISAVVMILVVAIFVFVAQFVFATHGGWHDPTTDPTGGNVPTPINATSEGQEKLGSITLGGDLYVSVGNFGIGNGVPAHKLDVGGNIRVRGLSGLIFDNGSIIEAPPVCRAGDDEFLFWEGGNWACKSI